MRHAAADRTRFGNGARRGRSGDPGRRADLITTRNLVLFPGTVLPITLGRQRSIAAAQAAIGSTGRSAGLAARSGDRGPDAGRPASGRHRSNLLRT